MPVYILRGRVLPDCMSVSLDYQPTFEITAAETIPDSRFQLELTENVLTVTADASSEPDDFRGLHFYAYDLARSVCDLLTTREGVVCVPLLETVELPDGSVAPTVLADRNLARCFTIHEKYGVEDILALIVTDIKISRLMADVTSMLTWTHYAPIAAGRIAESIRLLLAGGRSGKDWETMRNILNVDRAYLQLLTDRSAPPRHGDRQYVDGQTNATLAARAWTLTDRFLVYRLGGSKPLDPLLYPLLRG